MTTKMIMGEFKSATQLLNAAKKTSEEGYTLFETYSPFPIHGMDKAMKLGQSKLGWLALIGGLGGCIIGLGIQEWAAQIAYPLVISGKPLGSHAAFVPVTFELTILLTGFFTVFGMFALNKLPTFYNIVFNHSQFHKANCDSFFLSIDAKDPRYNSLATTQFLNSLNSINIEELEDEE